MAYALLGSTKLESTSNEIEVEGLAEKNFLVVQFHAVHATGSGNFNARFRFNDSTSGYASIETEDYGTTYNQVNDTNTENLTGTRTSGALMGIFRVSNTDGQAHTGFSNALAKETGSNAPRCKQVALYWSTTDRIEKVTMFSANTNYGEGSYLNVYGSD
jgi:hypothetical protein